MNQKRTASLSLKQGLGIVSIGTSLMFLLSCFVTTINVLVMGFYRMKGITNKIPFVIGSTIGILIVLGIAVTFFIIGLRLLKDKKGLYIPFLKN